MMPLVTPAGIGSDAAARPGSPMPAPADPPGPHRAGPATRPGDAPSASFEAALSQGPSGRTGPTTAAPGDLGERFEAAMLSPLVKAMLPPEDSAVWGGSGGSTWRSFYARELAAEIARSGGIGIADIVDRSAAGGIGRPA
jgi:hypothetical protein